MYMLKYLKLESFYLFTHDRKGMGRSPYYSTVIGKFCGKDQLSWRREEMTLIVCLFIIFLSNRTFLNLLQQRNVAVVDGLVVS